ncbi:MAG: hypothetical protein EP339_11120 [Gammaproteobacteria bacterium]|nr:MAG: hypothetical protein EP339_11120 [Gammaproteobacteria bacterium]
MQGLSMSSDSSHKSILSVSLFSLLMTGLLLLWAGVSQHPFSDDQSFDHHAPELVSSFDAGDSSPPEPLPLASFLSLFPEPGLAPDFVARAESVRPPRRLLSYPELPQAPPILA